MHTVLSAISAGRPVSAPRITRTTSQQPRRKVDPADGPLAASAWAFDARLDPLARLVALTISLHTDATGRAWPSVRRLSELTGLHVRTVTDRVQQLISLGLLADDGERRGRGVRVLRVAGYRPQSWQRGAVPSEADGRTAEARRITTAAPRVPQSMQRASTTTEAARVPQSNAASVATTEALTVTTEALTPCDCGTLDATEQGTRNMEKERANTNTVKTSMPSDARQRLAEARARMMSARLAAPARGVLQ